MAAAHKGETLELIPIRGVWTLPTQEELVAYRRQQFERQAQAFRESTNRTSKAFDDLAAAFQGFGFASGGFTAAAQKHAQRAADDVMGKMRDRLQKGPITFTIHTARGPMKPPKV